MNNLFARVLPFIFFGVMLVLLVIGIVLFSYILILGAIVGSVLFLIAFIRDKLFLSRHVTKTQPQEKAGRIIEHDDQH